MIDMRDCWPVGYFTKLYRRADGSLYAKRKTKGHDPMAYWLPAPQQGDVQFSREDHFPVTYGSEQTAFNNSWSMRKRDDMSVSEVADSFACGGDCSNWCAGPGQYYVEGVIPHGRPGGHVVGEACLSQEVEKIYNSQNFTTTQPTLLSGWKIHTTLRLEAEYALFHPLYGRDANGWGPNRGPVYSDVVELLQGHGVLNPALPQGTISPEYPPGINHKDGFTCFWVRQWFASGVGMIQEEVLFDERPTGLAGHGSLLPASGVDPIVYFSFIDNS